MFRVIRYVLTTVFFLGMFGAFAIFVLDIPVPWKASASEAPPPIRSHRALPAVELVKDVPYTLEIPEAVQRSLGIRNGNGDAVEAAKVPTQSYPLVLSGSTALDPGRIKRVRIRFAPAEVVKIPQRSDEDSPKGESQFRELRPGDEVKEKEELAIFHSVDVGSKKNDLFEAVIQYRLDKVILDRSEEKGGGALPEVMLWTYRRNVQTDRSAIIRAKNTLKTWNIPDEDIEAVIKEAEEYNLTTKQKTDYKDAYWGEKQDRWARVVLRSPCNGVIVERNLSLGETVVDNTLNLFTIAQLDKILVMANLPEYDLDLLKNLSYDERKWTVQTVGGDNPDGSPRPPSRIDEISRIIDSNQHTAILKGYIDNPGRKILAGQFVSATINLPAPRDEKRNPIVVEIPINALVEDGNQSIVFVENPTHKNWYTMRRVIVTHRFDKVAFVRSTKVDAKEQYLNADEKELGFLPREALEVGERVLLSGVMELKAALMEKEARKPKAN